MKIGFFCRNIHRNRGGIETFIRELSRALCQKGHQVHIIAEDRGVLFRQPWANGLTLHKIQIKETPWPGFWKAEQYFPVDDLRFAKAAARKLTEINAGLNEPIDIVETMDYFRQGAGIIKTHPIPIFLRLHGWVFNRQQGRVNPRKELSFKEKFQWRIQQQVINQVDGVAAVSADFAEYIKGVWDFKDRPVDVIHNAVDAKKYCAPPAEQKRERSVIFAARLAKIKGVKVLADAMPRVVQEFPEVKFYFAGGNLKWEEEGVTAEDYLRSKVPAENLEILGEVAPDKILKYYQNCSVCVLPSLYEPFGITAIESMACGCPVVAARAGGLQEIIQHEQNGLLVKPGDDQDLSLALSRLLRDEPFREKLGAAAGTRVREEFSYDKLVERSLAAYEKAITHYHTSRNNHAKS